jgi:transcriptional regulator
VYVPTTYRPPDPAWVLDTVREHPLALLVSEGDRVPHATHLLALPPSGEAPELVGQTLLGHMNRANPHWSALVDGGAALLVYTGPNGYVSPTVYGVTPAAPTWDFVSVHVRGTVRKIDRGEPTMAVVQRTVEFCERHFGAGWRYDDSLDYFRKILPGVGAFALEVTAVDGMFKLSQEQEPPLRRRVADSFACHPSTGQQSLAGLMRRLPASQGEDDTRGGE